MQDYSMQLKRLEKRTDEAINTREMKNVVMRAGIRKNRNVKGSKGQPGQKTKLITTEMENLPGNKENYRNMGTHDNVAKHILPEPFVTEDYKTAEKASDGMPKALSRICTYLTEKIMQYESACETYEEWFRREANHTRSEEFPRRDPSFEKPRFWLMI